MIQNGSTTQHKLLTMHINRNAFYIKDIVLSFYLAYDILH